MKGWYKDRMEDPSSGELAQLRQQIARLKTEHRKTESTLRTYQSAVESASDAIFVKDLKSRYVVANDKALAAFGLSRDEVIGRDDYELMPDQKEARKNVEDDRYVFQIGKPKRITRHMTGADGRESWFETGKVPQFDDEGNVIGLVGIARDITELKETEIALNGGERRYQTTFEHTGTAMLIIEEDTTISLVNHQFELLSGYSREEIEGKKSWAEFVHPEDLEGMKKSHYGRREPGAETLAQYEFRFIDRRGNVKDIFLTVDAIPGMKQSVAALIDITKRKQAEDALRESEQFSSSLMDGSPNPIVVVNPDTSVRYVNRALEDMTGFTAAELIGRKAPYPWWTKETLHKTGDDLAKAMKKGARKLEEEFNKKDGEQFWVEITSVPVERGGEFQYYLANWVNITERKKMESMLKESEEKFRALIENSSDIIQITDAGGIIRYVSPSVQRILGYKPEELIGRPSSEVVHPDDLPEVARGFEQAIQNPNALVITVCRCKHKDGTWRMIEGRGTNHLDNPAVNGFVASMSDITERKRMEVEKKEVEQRAQVASRLASVGEMASGIAHEINNPLVGVIGFAQLLMERDDISEDVREELEIIYNGGQRVADIVKRLLSFARQQKPERSYVSVNELIEATLKLRSYEMETANIEVDSRLDSDLPWTMADAGQLQQVFLNLVVNAEQAMRLANGRGRLTVRTEAKGETIRISFKDDGPGIAKENIGKIFNPFFTTREVGEGTGLGLSICHGIIAEHRGQIYVKSKLGKGTTFVMELPVIAEKEQVGMVEPAAEVEKAKKAKILVVDDEEINLQYLSKVLGGEGHEVDTVDNGAEALEMIKRGRYNLILADIKMPGMSGIELYRKLEEIARSLADRVVFITGDVMGEETMVFLSRTGARYITKPVDIKQLKEVVNSVLNGAG